MESVLRQLGLQEYYKEKISLKRLLLIDHNVLNDEAIQTSEDAVWFFLKKLMMVNGTARNVDFTAPTEPCSEEMEVNIADLLENIYSGDDISLHDIVTALFLCSDGFVHQELSLKMSLCQFAVPLLLPDYDTDQITFMLWALRDIVKKFRPESLSESKGFKEERIVLSQIPMISFVRLGECSLSKSEFLNKILSNSQQYHDFFVHHNMQGGDCARKISDGLVELTWYLPGGNKNIDIFNEPVAVANLRGDLASFKRQFSFLCRTSAAVFVFSDSPNGDCEELLAAKDKLFLVVNQQSKRFCVKGLQSFAEKLGLSNKNILLKSKNMNEAEFVKKFQKTIRGVVKDTNTKMSLEQMATVSKDFNILVDEDCPQSQAGKKNADTIISSIKDIQHFKETQLPRQGFAWRKLSELEKEAVRLKKVGNENLQQYQNKLEEDKRELRKEQSSYSISEEIKCFIKGISPESSMERMYFLKWMRINLDNLSLDKLTGLREQFKQEAKKANSKEVLRKIDEQLSGCSLGNEHFMREMSQIYEASVVEKGQLYNQMKHLPKHCAKLLLDGLPLELVDGDASNIPLRWVRDVLNELSQMVAPGSKVLVITVLGVQSTGKSTLLNTMFGVQFAVSSGRCTRGAYMLLIQVSEDMKAELNCDTLVIIDTEGLKSPELAQLDNSYEHDNELATLVVGLSDITMINISMENAVEMKDTLQIVVHAFLRMKEVGKKPKCQFVHQNVSDVSAHDKNFRDRDKLLQQLDKMTQAAAKMERKEGYKHFTDVMEYSVDTGNLYIPGLWNGTPPMAPVNAGYSEAVYELKKNVLCMLKDCQSTAKDFVQYGEWMDGLWKAVKLENFIFSFKNSLVADAYMQLCTVFNTWEWEFKKQMYEWGTTAETQINNIGIGTSVKGDVGSLLTTLEIDLKNELSKHEKNLLDNLKNYFEKKDGHVYLIESHKQDFQNSVKTLRNDLERSVRNQLTTAADIKKGKADIEKIDKDQTCKIEEEVFVLVENCRKRQVEMSESQLDQAFDQMWKRIRKQYNFKEQTPTDIFNIVQLLLLTNVQDKGSNASELLQKTLLRDYKTQYFKYSSDALRSLKDTFLSILGVEKAKTKLQALADNLIEQCESYVDNKVAGKTNYHDNFVGELLLKIDNCLKEEEYAHIEFEVSLKIHILANAARKFQKMHEDFLQLHDPLKTLAQKRGKFRSDFKDVFIKKDLCQKKATELTVDVLMPAVEKYLKSHLGTDIIGKIQSLPEMKQRMSFQSSVLQELLQKNDFNEYLKYTRRYESYVKDVIKRKIQMLFQDSTLINTYEKRHIEFCVSLINGAIANSKEKSKNLDDFIKNMCVELNKDLDISGVGSVSFRLALTNADKDQFAMWMTKSVEEMSKSLKAKLASIDTKTKIQSLHRNPEAEIFETVIGCGAQCPFCGVPCEAGSSDHSKHQATIHRPQAFASVRINSSQKLVPEICTTDVKSEASFQNSKTDDKLHPYKEYQKIYPDWDIPPDTSYEASDYWKFVLKEFNEKYATYYNAKPADIPPAWLILTKAEAKESVKKEYRC